MDTLMQLSKKHLDRVRALVLPDCGSMPTARDYGMREFDASRNPTVKRLLEKDGKEWRECSERVMATKHKKQQAEMKAEIIKAGKAAGLVK